MLHAHNARIRSFRVVPSLPEPLAPLLEIARNLWWTWNPDAVALFIRLDPDLWSEFRHNPVKLLGHVSQTRLEEASRDESFVHEMSRVHEAMSQHLRRQGWFNRTQGGNEDALIAYFCAEFGLTECFSIYSGGLGILAGDHLKSASELGIPLVAVGLLYQRGYFMQYLNADGWQQEEYPDLDFANQPIERVRDAEGQWLKVTVRMPERDVQVGVWKAQVGRVPLYLLDTNLVENRPDDRSITRNLYGGDVETRIQQEIVLGIGGVRALAAMNLRPTVCHMNEGHAAFLGLERIRMLIDEHGLSFEEARVAAAASHVFTTHTPVPAGIDRFHPSLMERYFADYVGSLGIGLDGLLALGREHPDHRDEFFSMATLAIRTAFARNGVSRLHGVVSRAMWQGLWPAVPEEEVAISHVTNGIHTRSWLSRDMMQLFDRYLGHRWQHEPSDHSVWRRVEDIPDEELWGIHQQQRRRLIAWVRRRVRAQYLARGTSVEEMERVVAALDPDAFTIGFARRFATYKRATLLLEDRERLLALLRNQDRPIQLLIAGKAHPADSAGKEFIRELVHFARSNGPDGARLVFLENYDINVARHLVTSCDLWLNTPRRGLEASGTSGMKGAVNGVINCSILDGWWDEAYRPEIGFAIGRRESYANDDEADAIESASLFDLLEGQILPEFYDRDRSGLPRRWVARMKRSIAALAPFFNTNRMVQEYTCNLYLPAHGRSRRLAEGNYAEARSLARQLARYHEHWHELGIESVSAPIQRSVPVRQALPIEAIVNLGSFAPGEVAVQVYTGDVSTDGDLLHGQVLPLNHVESLGGGRHRYAGEILPETSGRRGFAVRIVPNDPRLPNPIPSGLICWERPDSESASTVRSRAEVVAAS